MKNANGGGTVTLSSSVSGEILDADQLYSTAGNSALYKINSAYTTAGAVPTCSLTVLAENTYEISSLDAITPSTTCPGGFSITGGICVTVPGYSMGYFCLLYTSDAADERSSVDLGGRRIIKKKNTLVTIIDIL